MIENRGVSVPVGTPLVWTGAIGQHPAGSIRGYRDCTISNTGTGSLAITANFGNGEVTYATLASGEGDTYLMPSAKSITLTASSATCVVDIINHYELT